MITSKLKYRFFWTWDHSMDWTPLAQGIQESGASNPYYKRPPDFIQDYKNIIDFSAAHNFTGIIVYGFLRDCHGGIESAKEICQYGRQKNVLIIPGIGVNSYGGVYWDGNHEFNLFNWVKRHPEIEAVGEVHPNQQNRFGHMLCPSKKENREWMKDAVRWLCETFDIGGINFETGDYGLCKCEQCQTRSNRTAGWSVDDIAEQLPPLIEEGEKAIPDFLPICECYFDNILDTDSFTPLQALPDSAILQFCINTPYWPRFQKEMDSQKLAQLPRHPKILRTHMGSQWNGQRHAFVAREFAQMTKKAAEIGMDGITIFGEVSYLKTVHEINYLSVADFADNPGLTWDEFMHQKLSPLLGSKELALKYIELLEKKEIEQGDLETAKSILSIVKGPVYRRWLWLLELLCQWSELQD